MKSIEKLRELADKLDDAAARTSEHGFSPIGIKASVIADEIEAEIAENYMLLPWDADGVPIHVGDVMEYENPNDDDKPFTVLGVNNDGDVFHCLEDKRRVPTCISLANCLHHVKPDSLKELLDDVSKGIICYPRERVTGYLEDNHSIGEAVMLDVRDRLRELLGGDAE